MIQDFTLEPKLISRLGAIRAFFFKSQTWSNPPKHHSRIQRRDPRILVTHGKKKGGAFSRKREGEKKKPLKIRHLLKESYPSTANGLAIPSIPIRHFSDLSLGIVVISKRCAECRERRKPLSTALSLCPYKTLRCTFAPMIGPSPPTHLPHSVMPAAAK